MTRNNRLLLLSVLALVVIGYVFLVLKSLVNKYLYAKGKLINGVIVLPDILHFDNIPNNVLKKLQKLADWLVLAVTWLVIAYFLLKGRFDYIVLFGIYMLVLNVAYIIYSVATVLPDSKNGECVLSDRWYSNITNMGSCNNLGVSGHLGTVGIALFLLCQYQGFGNSCLVIASLLLYIAAFAIISISRNHYTIDCINTTMLLLILCAYGPKKN